MDDRTPILHADLDAFYASVEQLIDPRLRGRPVLVGGGVVLAASYEARAFGISAPMGVKQALARCPHAVVVPGSFERYLDYSKQVFEICERYTPLVEPISIDEAFLDVMGSTHLFGDSATIGAAVRAAVKNEIGLPISVGVARTKFLAKVASAQAKPDGLLVVPPDEELDFLHALGVQAIWGVGPVTARRLGEFGIKTVGELAVTPVETLIRWLGPGSGRHLHALAWNRDPRPVVTVRRAGSVGAQSALGRGTDDPQALATILLRLADRVSSRMRRNGRTARVVTVRVRDSDRGVVTRRCTLPDPVSSTAAIHHAALPLLTEARSSRPGPVTLVGISMSGLQKRAPLQLEIPFDAGDPTRSGTPIGLAHSLVDEQVDEVRGRFGRDAVGRASVVLRPRRGVPDQFRELAEKS